MPPSPTATYRSPGPPWVDGVPVSPPPQVLHAVGQPKAVTASCADSYSQSMKHLLCALPCSRFMKHLLCALACGQSTKHLLCALTCSPALQVLIHRVRGRPYFSRLRQMRSGGLSHSMTS